MKPLSFFCAQLLFLLILLSSGCDEKICTLMAPMANQEIYVAPIDGSALPPGEYNITMSLDEITIPIDFSVDAEGKATIADDSETDLFYVGLQWQEEEASLTISLSYSCPNHTIDIASVELEFNGTIVDQSSITPVYDDDPTEPNGPNCGECWIMDNTFPTLLVPSN